MALLTGAGTPKRWADRRSNLFLAVFQTDDLVIVLLFAVADTEGIVAMGLLGITAIP